MVGSEVPATALTQERRLFQLKSRGARLWVPVGFCAFLFESASFVWGIA